MRFIIPIKRVQKYLVDSNPYVRELVETDVILDISGGDSFSDIYGMWRFYSGFLPKWMVLLYRKPLVFLPQTYGPYNKKITRLLAKYLVNKARIVFSRDKYSCIILEKLFASHPAMITKKLFHVPDVAFVLPPAKPVKMTIEEGFHKGKGDIIIGFNISGLLYHGGYTQDNMFGLNVDYRKLVDSIIDLFMKIDNTKIILVPHVIPDLSVNFSEAGVENDYGVCRDVYNKNIKQYPGRIFLAYGKYNHNEIKYIIGRSDFFLGSRMHSCIAALSQCIPAIGIAYSRKFEGVFASIGVEKCVVDMRKETISEIIKTVYRLFTERNDISRHLNSVIPDVKHRVINLLNSVEL